MPRRRGLAIQQVSNWVTGATQRNLNDLGREEARKLGVMRCRAQGRRRTVYNSRLVPARRLLRVSGW